MGEMPQLELGDSGFTFGLLYSVEELIARDTRVRILQIKL